MDLDKIQAELEKHEFAEMNLATGWQSFVHTENGEVKDISSGSSSSLGIRVLINGAFGFATTSNPDNWEHALKEAVKMARSNPRPMKSGLSREDEYEDKWVVKPKKSLRTGIDEKIKNLTDVYKSLDVPTSVKMVDLNLSCSDVTRYYVNSQGSRIIQKYPRSAISISSTARGKFVISARDAIGGLYGLEIFDMIKDRFQETVDRSRRLLKSKRAPTGKLQAVLDPEMAGVFAHEAIGHACEGDAIVNRTSILRNKLGTRIGSDLVSIVDDATLPRKYGSYGYDYEGIPGQRTVLVKNGILQGYMNSRETAHELKTRSTGNSRAQGPDNFPLVRMSNTFFEGGDSSLDEMIEDVRYGVYIHRMNGGETDPNSGFFQFAAEYGELIENGERTELLRDIVISGNFLQILHNIDAVGSDVSVDDIGICGKSGQGVPVGDGGPHLRVREVLLG